MMLHVQHHRATAAAFVEDTKLTSRAATWPNRFKTSFTNKSKSHYASKTIVTKKKKSNVVLTKAIHYIYAMHVVKRFPLIPLFLFSPPNLSLLLSGVLLHLSQSFNVNLL